jgi:hypothetical protein
MFSIYDLVWRGLEYDTAKDQNQLQGIAKHMGRNSTLA